MTTITLEVPDELAAQLNNNPSILATLIQEVAVYKLSKDVPQAASSTYTKPLYQEIIDFLLSNPTLQQKADFKISDEAQERLEDLLYRNREEGLSLAENAELDRYLQYRHLMILLKLNAKSLLKGKLAN